jgi:hypothetical protein
MTLHSIKSSLLRPAKALLVAFACSLLLLSHALPAMAISANKSALTDGTAQLSNIEKKSQDAANSGLLNGKQVQKEANQGINEIQGAADADKMNRPSNSQDAVTVLDQVKGAFENVTDKG